MTAHRAVADGDTTNHTNFDQLIAPKLRDLERRIAEGTLPAGPVARAIQQIVEGEFVIGGLLKFVGVLELKAVKTFVVADNFKVGNKIGGRRLNWLGDNFQHHFGDVVEENVPARTLYVWELTKNSVETPIITALGGASSSETQIALAHLYQMMEMGEKGRGRLDGYANFGYKLSPKDGALWVPRWYVFGGEFSVGAYSSSGPPEWHDGYRVVSG